LKKKKKLKTKKITSLWFIGKRLEISIKYLVLVVVRILTGVIVRERKKKNKILHRKMIILNYCLPAYNYKEWDYLLKNHDVSMEYPPSHLHLNIDVTRLTPDDVDWMKIYCRDQLTEIIPEIKKHNERLRNYKLKMQKMNPPKIMTKVKKK
jgi:hypothetical protein